MLLLLKDAENRFIFLSTLRKNKDVEKHSLQDLNILKVEVWPI